MSLRNGGHMPEQFFALRGSRSLSREEFEAHLALAIRLENVAVLLGAGASKCVGGQTMEDIWTAVEAGYTADITWLRDHHFLPDGEKPNIEQLLDQIEIAHRDTERRQVESDVIRLSQVRHVLRKAVVRAAILEEELWLRPDKSIICERFGHPSGFSHGWSGTGNRDKRPHGSSRQTTIFPLNGLRKLSVFIALTGLRGYTTVLSAPAASISD
jgi:hypothetical protein